MSVLANLFGGGPTATTRGEHTISQSSALAPTTPHAITPTSPPNWDGTNVRTIPIIPKYRPFSWSEAEAMSTQAIQRETESKNWHTVVEAAEKIEKLDAKDHQRFRGYQGVVAREELKKLQGNAKLGEKLHQLRPGYASLSHQMESGEIQASRQITELSNKYKAMMV